MTTQDLRLMGQKDATPLGYFPALSNGMIVGISRYGDNEQVNRMSWIWRVVPGGPKDQVTWEI